MSLMTVDKGYEYKSNLLKKVYGKAGLIWDYVSDGDLGLDPVIFIVHPRLGENFFTIDLMGNVTKTDIKKNPAMKLEVMEKSFTNNPIEPEESLVGYLQRWFKKPFSNDKKIIGEAKNGANLVDRIRKKNSFPELLSLAQEIDLQQIAQETSSTTTITTKKKP